MERAEEEVAGLFVDFGFLLAADGGKAVEEELADVGHGDGVAAGDAFVGELADEVAEEDVDGVGGGEVGDFAEEFSGDGFVVAALLLEAFAGVVGAEFRIGTDGEHVAAASAGVGELADGRGGEKDGGASGNGRPCPRSICVSL